MTAVQVAAIVGLLGLVSGMVAVNAARSPNAARLGTVGALLGVILLALVALYQLIV
ncbi:hypothetical protein [Bradyrhizobium lablabi]|uniref:hypothetical protein n=1 Tax=Bradyrhizobium lablabi TaxID=722472 RepID=UPI001BAC2443|nr:hypothetical protein [Bradyrhizobium lablabi]MBR0694817.1 hypothetical protein [Bradyrhizobium lablabi]